jgi:hypothetical protein
MDFRRHDVPLRSASGARRVAFLITCKFAAPATGATDPSDFFLPAERYDRIFFFKFPQGAIYSRAGETSDHFMSIITPPTFLIIIFGK